MLERSCGWCRGPGEMRRRVERADRVVLVLRRLHRDEVLDAACCRASSWASPGCSTRARPGRRWRRRALVQPELPGHGAVDVDAQLRLARAPGRGGRRPRRGWRARSRRSSARWRRCARRRRARPTTCMSMGAGRPKLSTCVEMSGARKKNVVSGYVVVEDLAQLAHVARRGRVVLLERDEDLAVGRRDQRALAEREVEPAVGDADVVEHRLDLAGGMTPRMVSSMRAMRFSVSSMRVPGGPRTWSLMRPASTLGKKSRPTSGKSESERRHEREEADDERCAGAASAQAEPAPVAACAGARSRARSRRRRARRGRGARARGGPRRSARPRPSAGSAPSSAPACARGSTR